MPRYVAFLRAINVGGHTVSMARLVELFEALDFTGVRTFIASGNVLFNAAAKSALVERQLDRHLEAELGYRAEAFVRTVPELAGILANNPYPEADVASAHALMLGFLRTAPTRAVATKVEAMSGPTDTLQFDGRELYWLRTTRESDPKLATTLERAIGQPMTVRNSNTIRRILAKERGE